MTKPAFELLLPNATAASNAFIQKRMLSLEAIDVRGRIQDTLKFVLDNTGNQIRQPQTGAELTLKLGYEGAPLTWIGNFRVDETALNFHPLTWEISGGTARHKQGQEKIPHTRTWDGVTLEQIVQTVAREHGFNAVVGDNLNVSFKILHQNAESDMALLERLASSHDALFKIKGNVFLFKKKDDPIEAIPKQVRDYQDLISGRVVPQSNRQQYKGVSSHYWDADQAERKHERVGQPPFLELPKQHRNQAFARNEALAKFNDLVRQTGKLSFAVEGDPQLFAEAELEIVNGPSAFGGAWLIQKVTHRYSKEAGFTTHVEAEPKAGGSHVTATP